MPSAPQTRVLDPRDAQAGEYTAAWDAITKLTREGSSWSGYERKNVFLNCGPGHAFANVPGVMGMDYNDDGRAAALVDWDGDGAQDFWLRNRTGPRLRLLRNRGAGQEFVALKLEGTGSTARDAIGARVTIKLKDAPPIYQTLRAGEGFLSQGSKILTIGLGTGGTLAGVDVRWPGGKSESFSGVEKGARFLLRQGSGKAERLTVPAAPVLAAKVVPPLAITGQLAVSLPVRVPMPRCSYTTEDGSQKDAAAAGRPLLLLYYSHTCPNCAAEMKALTAAKAQLDSAGLDILALSIDAATSADPAQGAAAFQTLKERAWPWPSGTAAPAAIHHMEEFTRAVLEYPPPPSVPSAYLIAPGDKVCVLYRGRIGIERLLHDLPAAICPPDELRDRSIPVAGRWFTSSHRDDAMLEWVFKHFGPAFIEQRITYLEQAAAATTDKEGFHNQIAASRHKYARDLAAAKKLDEAEREFAAAAALGVKSPALYNDYGALLAFRGKITEAAAQYRRALEIDPKFNLAKENLANLPRQDQGGSGNAN